jgi:hypothetical protein
MSRNPRPVSAAESRSWWWWDSDAQRIGEERPDFLSIETPGGPDDSDDDIPPSTISAPGSGTVGGGAGPGAGAGTGAA